MEEESSSRGANAFLEILMNNQAASPIYFTKVNEGSRDASELTFGKHFNPDLARDSSYFQHLAEVMKCVEKHAEVAKD